MTDLDTKIAALLLPLQDYLDDTPPEIEGFDGYMAVQGNLQGLRFRVMISHQGRIEAGLWVQKKRNKRRGLRVYRETVHRPASPGAAAKFLQVWGVEPVASGQLVNGCVRRYVVRAPKDW